MQSYCKKIALIYFLETDRLEIRNNLNFNIQEISWKRILKFKHLWHYPQKGVVPGGR